MTKHQRQEQIVARLMTEERLTTQELCVEYDVSDRIIRKDMKQLCEQGWPIAFDRRRDQMCWYLDSSSVRLPMTSFVEPDILALLEARMALGQARGTPAYDEANRTFDRILDSFGPKVRKRWDAIADRIRYGGPAYVASSEDHDRIHRHLEQIRDVLIDKPRTLDVQVRRSKTGNKLRVGFDPYGLILVNGEWQVVGFHHGHQSIRTLLVSRIEALVVTGQYFQEHENWISLDHYLETSIDGGQAWGPIHHVILRFTNDGTHAAIDHVWNRTQKRRFDKQGRLIIEFATRAMYMVERKVLSWGDKVEVISPPNLRQAVRKQAQRIARLNVGDADTV